MLSVLIWSFLWSKILEISKPNHFEKKKKKFKAILCNFLHSKKVTWKTSKRNTGAANVHLRKVGIVLDPAETHGVKVAGYIVPTNLATARPQENQQEEEKIPALHPQLKRCTLHYLHGSSALDESFVFVIFLAFFSLSFQSEELNFNRIFNN